jgi:hypothetical protein
MTDYWLDNGACGGTVGWGTVLQARGSQVRFPMVWVQFFIDIILPATLQAMGSTQPPTNKSIRNISLEGKGSWCVGLTLPHSCAYCHESWEPEPPGTLRACPGLYRDYVAFTLLTIQLQYSIINIKILYFSFLTCCHVLLVSIIAKYILFQNSHHYTHSHSVKKWNPYLELIPYASTCTQFFHTF